MAKSNIIIVAIIKANCRISLLDGGLSGCLFFIINPAQILVANLDHPENYLVQF